MNRDLHEPGAHPPAFDIKPASKKEQMVTEAPSLRRERAPKEGATALRSARKQRIESEAEQRVQAWFDIGMKPAERQQGLEMIVEDLENTFSEMEPNTGEDPDDFYKRTVEVQEELDGAKAELTILKRRIAEKKQQEIDALPELSASNIAALDQPMIMEDLDPDKRLEGMSQETTMVLNRSTDKPAVKVSGGLNPEIAEPLRYPSMVERPKPTSESLGTLVADGAKSVWGRISGWFKRNEEVQQTAITSRAEPGKYQENLARRAISTKENTERAKRAMQEYGKLYQKVEARAKTDRKILEYTTALAGPIEHQHTRDVLERKIRERKTELYKRLVAKQESNDSADETRKNIIAQQTTYEKDRQDQQMAAK